MDGGVVLAHLFLYQENIMSPFHLAMCCLHLFVHFEAVSVLFLERGFIIENTIKRAFVLAEGQEYEKTFVDIFYKFLTFQDIVTHLMNIYSFFRKGATVFDVVMCLLPFFALYRYFYYMARLNNKKRRYVETMKK